jgi:hypothetical protein
MVFVGLKEQQRKLSPFPFLFCCNFDWELGKWGSGTIHRHDLTKGLARSFLVGINHNHKSQAIFFSPQ